MITVIFCAGAGISAGSEDIHAQERAVSGMEHGLRAGPYRVNGEIRGFRIFRTAEDSIFGRTGLAEGDIITHVDGREVKSAEIFYESMQGFKTGTTHRFTVLRAGKIVTLEFVVKGD